MLVTKSTPEIYKVPPMGGTRWTLRLKKVGLAVEGGAPQNRARRSSRAEYDIPLCRFISKGPSNCPCIPIPERAFTSSTFLDGPSSQQLRTTK